MGQLRNSRCEGRSYFPSLPGMLNLRVNYRNHRKIVVIDGNTGFVGGFNIGREYISKDPKFGYWRDTHLEIRGEAAISLQIRFALDWNYVTGENLFKDIRYLEGRKSTPDAVWGNISVQTGRSRETAEGLPVCRSLPAGRILRSPYPQ